MKSIIRFGTVALSLTVAAGAQAQSTASDSGLEEVRITAQRLEDTLPEQLARSGVKVEVVDSQQIRNGGYVDVAGSLQALAPGLFVMPKNGPFDYADISLQGSRTADVLWLVDGVRVNNRLYAGTVPLDTLPSAMVDRIEVLEGGQALFYGTEAIGGAVNVVTKPFSATPTGTATLGADSNNARHLDFNFADGTRFGQFVLYGSEDRSSGIKAFRDQDYQPSSTDRRRSYDVTTLGGKYAIDFNEQVRLSASYQHTDADLDYAVPFRVARDVNSRKEDLATLKLDVQATSKLGFFIKSYYHNWHTDYDTFYNDLATPGQITAVYQDAFWGYKDRGINVLGKYDFTPGLQAYFGYDLQRYGGKDEVLVIDQNDETAQAVFAQLRLLPALVQNLTLAAGVRYNRPDVGEQATIWNFSGQYQLPADLYLKGQLGTNFRLPSAEELFANDPFDERGNPNLKPERSKGINLSFGGYLPAGAQKLHWELTGFARDIDNLIDYGDLNAEGQYVFENVPGIVRTRGGQAQLDGTFQSVTVNGSYSYSHTTDDSGRQLDRVPRRLFKAGLDYHPAAQPFGATATLNYTGDITRTIAGTEFHYGRFVVVDVSGRYFPDADHHQQLNLSVRNLLDRHYGSPSRGCADVASDGTYDCSNPYFYENRGLPRTFAVSYTYRY